MRRFGVHFLLASLAVQQAVASDATKLHGFGLADTNAATPGYGRVVLVFLMVAGLAWAATWLLRRFGAKLPGAVSGGDAAIRHLARHALPGGGACHVVEAQGRQVLITVTRNGVSSLLLGEAPPTAPGPSA